ncbi:MAG: hypothetical protein MK135_02100, partial [Polyangiaceae bacterium]|nr:hypothetical protein [Polyangiaceae bacterium]
FQTAIEFAQALEPFRESGLGEDGRQRQPETRQDSSGRKDAPLRDDSQAFHAAVGEKSISLPTLAMVGVSCVILGGLVALVLMKFLNP